MRHLLLVAILFVSACQSKPDKLAQAKKVILTKIKESAHDWKSYEPVKWGTMDSSYTFYADDSVYLKASEDFDKAMEEVKQQQDLAEVWVSSISYTGSSRFNYYMKEAKHYREIAKEALDRMDSVKKNFKKAFNGYTLAHSYRVNNASGHLGISHDLYYLDTALKIVKVNDISAEYYDNKKKESEK